MSNSNGATQTTVKCTAWSGCDVAKATFEAAVAAPGIAHPANQWRQLPYRSFARTPEGVRQYLEWIDLTLAADPCAPEDSTLHVICEHTGRYSQELIQWLCAERPTLRWTIVHPTRAAHYARSLIAAAKTDPIEARTLTQFGLERRPACDEPIDPAQAELRDLSRYRMELVQERTAQKNRAQEPTASPLVRQMQNRQIAELDRQIQRLEKKMQRVLRKLPRLFADAQMIETIAGVGSITAIAIVAELGDLRRFATARQLSAFTGLAPRVFNSGTSVHRRVRMSKAGEPRIRALLYMCALTASVHNPQMKAVYERLTGAGKANMVALAALMRKLLVLMRAIILSGQAYRRDLATGTNAGKPGEKPRAKE